MKVENEYQYQELINWIEGAVRTISNGLTDRMDNKKYNTTVYRVKNIIRVDIK